MKTDETTTALTVPQNLTPNVWNMLKDIGEAFCRAGKFSVHSPSEGAIKALFCLENNLPLTAARGLYVVNGKLGIESGVIAALIRRHPSYDYSVDRLDDQGCTITITRNGEKLGSASFTEQDAERAELLQKNTFQKYPQDMMFAKAITRAQRRYAPDIFMAAVYSSEGMNDWDIVDVTPVEPPAPTHQELIDMYGFEAVKEAGGMKAQTAQELREIAEKLFDTLENA